MVKKQTLETWHPSSHCLKERRDCSLSVLPLEVSFFDKLKGLRNRDKTAELLWRPSPILSAQEEPVIMPVILKEQAGSSPTILVSLFRGVKIFYRKYLKRYAVVQAGVHSLLRFLLPLYGFISFFVCSLRPQSGGFSLVPQAVFKGLLFVNKQFLVKAETVQVPALKFYPYVDGQQDIFPQTSYVFPEIYCSVISNGIAIGASNLIKAGQQVVHHDLYDWEKDSASEELHARIKIKVTTKKCLFLKKLAYVEGLEKAAPFLDACASNYAHWMTEVLPRIAVFCAQKKHRGVPIVINAGLHKNILESLSYIAGKNRKVYTLEKGQAVKIKKLYLTSVAGYLPFEQRKISASDYSNGKFSKYAINLIVNQALTEVKNISATAWPKKVYLKRSSAVRSLINSQEVEAFLVQEGFTIVQSEQLSFLEQVMLFKNANIIVAPTGASLANIIFTSANTQIFILINEYKHTCYYYWQNISMASSQNNITYILGKHDRFLYNHVHASYRININDLKTALKDTRNV